MKISQSSWHYRYYIFIIDKLFIIDDYERHPKSLCTYFWCWVGAPFVLVFTRIVLPVIALIIVIGTSPIFLWFYIRDKAPNKTKIFVELWHSFKNKVCPKIDYE